MNALQLIFFLPLTACGMMLCIVVGAAVDGEEFRLPFLTDAGFPSWFQLVVVVATLLAIPALYFRRATRVPHETGSMGYSRTYWIVLSFCMYVSGIAAGLLAFLSLF